MERQTQVFFMLILALAWPVLAGADARSDLKRIHRQIDTLNANIEKQNTALTQLVAQISTTEAALQTAQTTLQEHLSAFHIYARNTLRMATFPWQAQVALDVLNHTPSRKGLAQQIHQQQRDQQHTQRATIDQLLAQQIKLHKAYQQQAVLHQNLAKERTRLLSAQNRALKKIGIENRKLANRLNSTSTLFNGTTMPASLRKKPTPADAPVKGFILGTDNSNMKGIRIEGTAGAPVIAHKGGRVIFSGAYREFGDIIILETTPNRRDVYAGLGYRKHKVGASVSKGATLGTLPNTTAPVFYFEQRRGDTVLATAL